jgi:c(7)-type cytochrome triheme protein
MPRLSQLATALFLSSVLVGVALAVEGDVVFKRESGEMGTQLAVFPHWKHRIRYKCYACHPSLFEMKAGADKVSMAAIQEGQFCGVCHNGTTAWAVSIDTCNQCHVGK